MRESYALVGIVLEFIVLRYLRSVAEKTDWEGDDALLQAIRGFTTLWVMLGSGYIAFQRMHIAQPWYDWTQQAFWVVGIFSVTAAAARLAGSVLDTYTQRASGGVSSTSILSNIVRASVYGVGLLTVLQVLGVEITPILTALGVGGLAVALAMQETLSNVFSGIHIIASRHISPGDYIKLASGEEGTVKDITWRNTLLRNVSQHTIIVPNSELASEIITNYTLTRHQIVARVSIGVGYDTDLDHAEAVATDVARAVLTALHAAPTETSKQPLVRYSELGDSSITMNVTLYGNDDTNLFVLRHEFIKAITERFAAEGIDIPYPTRTIYTKAAPRKRKRPTTA